MLILILAATPCKTILLRFGEPWPSEKCCDAMLLIILQYFYYIEELNWKRKTIDSLNTFYRKFKKTTKLRKITNARGII